jgi:hypothetical protein
MPSQVHGQGPPSRWILAYAADAGRIPYSTADFIRLIAVVDTSGRPKAWLFDGVMYVVQRLPNRGRFITWLGPPYATGSDWEAYLDSLFAGGGVLARLDSAVGAVGSRVGDAGRRVAVSLTIPYPEPKADTLRFFGERYDLGTIEGRVGATTQFVRSALARFPTMKFEHLTLDSFYWLHEAISGDEEQVVSLVAERVHAAHKRFLWIPYYGAEGVASWKRFGFDEAFFQPNYFFNPAVLTTRLDSAMARAREFGMGLEIEFDARVFTKPDQFADRLDPYLLALDRAPDLRARSIAVFDGAGALVRLSSSGDARYRRIYCGLVNVLRGLEVSC